MSDFNYKKRPYRAACLQWRGDNADVIIGLLKDAQIFREEYIMIRHPGGVHTLRRGDWVIRGEDGECRFYTDEVFAANYEVIG